MSTKIGTPDVGLIAREIALAGYKSCAEAEDHGWMVTHDNETRDSVDKILANRPREEEMDDDRKQAELDRVDREMVLMWVLDTLERFDVEELVQVEFRVADRIQRLRRKDEL